MQESNYYTTKLPHVASDEQQAVEENVVEEQACETHARSEQPLDQRSDGEEPNDGDVKKETET